MKTWRDILLVSDEGVVQKVTRQIVDLDSLGMDLAVDLRSARSSMEAALYKLILSDLKLPGGSGFELIEMARACSPATQVVIMTGYATFENAVRSFELGAFDFLPKPFDVPELRGIVRRGLRAWARLLEQPGERPKSTVEPWKVTRPPARHGLGRHSWTSTDPSGVATCGIGETIARTADPLIRVELPAIEEDLLQGDQMARLIPVDRTVYRVWTPLSGRVIAANDRLRHDPNLLVRDPDGAGWLVKILPQDLEGELARLDPWPSS